MTWRALPSSTHRSNSTVVASKILRLFEAPFEVLGHDVFLGASIGISLYPEHGTTVDDLVRRADSAMYRAKANGRNDFQYYSSLSTPRPLVDLRCTAGVPALESLPRESID